MIINYFECLFVQSYLIHRLTHRFKHKHFPFPSRFDDGVEVEPQGEVEEEGVILRYSEIVHLRKGRTREIHS